VYSGHLGNDKTKDLVTRAFYWPKMRKDSSGYVKSCKIYPTQKDERHKEYNTEVGISIAELPWQKVKIDCITDLLVKSKVRTANWFS